MNINFIIHNIHHPQFPDYDPLNPPMTVQKSRFSYDEPLPEALELAHRLRDVLTESDLLRTVWEAFRDQFIDCNGGDRDAEEYRDAVFDMWRKFCR